MEQGYGVRLATTERRASFGVEPNERALFEVLDSRGYIFGAVDDDDFARDVAWREGGY